MSPEQASLLRNAADVLEGRLDDTAATDFLRWLGAENAHDPVDTTDLIRLLRFAANLERLFELPVPDAPGLIAFGAEVAAPSPISGSANLIGTSGIGFQRLDAFRSCVAEAIEHVSQYGSGSEHTSFEAMSVKDLQKTPFSNHLSGLAADDAEVSVLTLETSDHQIMQVPAILCFRDAGTEACTPAYRIGLGCAAGRTIQEAREHAILEWVERDAAALWWLGRQKGRPIGQETLAEGNLSSLIEGARKGRQDRHTWFLDISTDIAVPVVVAVSVDQQGEEFAFGFGAGLSSGSALGSAFLELCQIELADRVVDAKLNERGEAALNENDRVHQSRRKLIHAEFDLLHPFGGPRQFDTPVDLNDALSASGIRAATMELTRNSIGIPVARVITPDLQPFPAEFTLPRLDETLSANKHHVHNHRGIRLV